MARLLPLVLFLSAVACAKHLGVCNHPYCECAHAAHPVWTTVNCTLPSTEKLNIFDGDLPDNTANIIVTGAEAVLFGVNSLSRLKDVRLVSLYDVRIVLMRKFAALNLDVLNLYLEVKACDVLRMEERTFSNIKGPLTVSLSDCDYVSLEGEAFSWLLSISIANVRELQLSSAAFMLDPTAANVGEHGPGMAVELKNLTMPEIPGQTFGSSAANITMKSVNVRTVRSTAFSANTYNVVMVVNCTFHLIEAEAFAQKSLINNLHFYDCKIHRLASRAVQSGVSSLNISHSRFENIETGAINATVASVVILNSVFINFKERGFVLSYWNKLQMERNSFDELASNAIVAPDASIHELVFVENEIETINPDSLGFIGQALANSAHNVIYKDNYYGQPCYCNISNWLAKALGAQSVDQYITQSYCTVDEFFARCFNVPEQNMRFKKFLDGVCTEETSIKCEPFKTKTEGEKTEIKNPRFPHKNKDQGGLNERDKKVIGIVIVTILGCIIIVMFISFIRWMRRRGYCIQLKNLLISSNSSCGSFCDKLCNCGRSNGLDNARSISQLSVNEYTERHRLNEPRVQDLVQETTLPEMYTEELVPTEDKTTQTLPEELTKELLENLREKLDDPENYVEAREMIEHLYELIKVEESCNANSPTSMIADENIYELPFQNTTPRMGKNKKQMISVGTRTPSLDKLSPLSPYNRQTALAHEYFEPKDFAVHLYAEIANCDKDKKVLLGTMPDVLAEQQIPRGPYLRAVREKMSANSENNASPSGKPKNHFILNSHSHPTSTTKSNKSIGSNSSGKMINRPLPEKPATLDPGEGTSFKHG